jgi:integrase
MASFGSPVRLRFRGKKSKNYYCRVNRDGGWTWRTTECQTFEAANKKRKQWELADARGEKPLDAIKLAAAVEKWLESKHAMTPQGAGAYRIYLDSMAAFFPKGAEPRDVTKARMEAYFAERAKEVSAGTLNKQRTVARQFWRWMLEHGYAAEDATSTIRAYKREEREIRVLTFAEETALLRAATENYKVKILAFRNAGGPEGGKKTGKKSKWKQTRTPPPWLANLIRLALETGLRYRSLSELEWGEVDLKAGAIRLPPAKVKTRAGLTVPLTAAAVAVLRELKAGARTMRVLNLPDRGDVRRAFQGAVKRSKIRHCRFHDLRASWVTRARKAGIGLEVVAAIAGHRDPRTTLKYYRQVDQAELAEAAEKLEAVRALDSRKVLR